MEVCRWEGKVVLSIKNISRQPLNIPAERLMERFVRGEESRTTEGSGLGLSIVRDTVLQHGGAVTARRREPEGTCFEVSFAQWNGEEVGR